LSQVSSSMGVFNQSWMTPKKSGDSMVSTVMGER
jgi:hypothetical protein